MVAEPWILKMGNQVSSNLKHALLSSSTFEEIISFQIPTHRQNPEEDRQHSLLRDRQCHVQDRPPPQVLHQLRDLKLKNEILKFRKKIAGNGAVLNLQMVVLLLEGKDCNFTSICYCVPPSNHFMLVGKEEVKSDHDECKTNEDFPSIDPTTIAAATESFSVANKLGRGGFGSVYKGVFYNGNTVKRLRSILVKELKSLAMKSC
ncbi:hypothetical protein FF1_005079 [Malus domestica]